MRVGTTMRMMMKKMAMKRRMRVGTTRKVMMKMDQDCQLFMITLLTLMKMTRLTMKEERRKRVETMMRRRFSKDKESRGNMMKRMENNPECIVTYKLRYITLQVLIISVILIENPSV